MKYLVAVMLLLSGIALAHTVTLNYAARIGGDVTQNTLHVNNTNYSTATSIKVNFSNLAPAYISINKTNTMTSIFSAGNLINSAVNNTYYYRHENSNTIQVLHFDNSTLDSGPYGNNLTSINGVDCSSSVTGKLNTACSFDGINDYMNGSILAGLEGLNYTISLWVNTLASNVGIFSQANGSSHRIEIFLSSGQVNLLTFEGGSASLSYSNAINDGQWHHIAVIKSGSTGKLFVDGVARDSGTTATVASTSELIVGARFDATNKFGGRLDEIVIYNKTLSTAEIHDLYLFDPKYILGQMKQDSTNNRFLIVFTNGTYGDLDSQTDTVKLSRIISSTVGKFVVKVPETFPIFIRLEYPDIDLENVLKWSGTGKLIVTNHGNTQKNIPNVSLGLIR